MIDSRAFDHDIIHALEEVPLTHVLGEDVSHKLLEEDLKNLVLGPGVSEEPGLRPDIELGAGKFLLEWDRDEVFLFLLTEFLDWTDR